MNTLQNDVREFHEAFSHPAPKFPLDDMSDETVEHMIRRAAWLHEEADELEEAARKRDVIGVLDALGDSGYFAVGGFVVLGHEMQPYWDNIHEANMAKLDPETGAPTLRESDGKVMKPEGWVPPEERHRVTFGNDIAAAKIESAARQLAYLGLTQPDTLIALPEGEGLTPYQWVQVTARADRIMAGGEEVVRNLYQEIISHIEEYVA